MTVPSYLGVLGRLFVVLAVILFLPASNVLLLATPAFVAHEYRQPGFPASERYDAPVRLRLAQETLRWVNAGHDIEALRALRHGGETVYNARELRHMADVSAVFGGLRWAWRLAGFVLLVGLAAAVWRPGWRWLFARSAFRGSALLVAALAGILISALLSFDWFFVRFHQVFFAAESYLFSYEDSLIQFYPVQFWMDATWLLGAATLVEGLLVGGLSLAYLGKSRRPT